MKIDLTSPSNSSPEYRSEISACQISPVQYASSLREGRRRGGGISYFFSVIYEKLQNFYHWVLSFFYTKKKEDKLPYTKLSKDNHEIEYRLAGSKNGVALSQKVAHLKDIILPEKDKIDEVGDMVTELMEKEQIDCLEVSNLYLANLLWNSGLVTQDLIQFSSGSPNLLTTVFAKLPDRLSKNGMQALNNIYMGIARCVIHGSSTIPEEYWDQSKDQAKGNDFNPTQAYTYFGQIEKDLKMLLPLHNMPSLFDPHSYEYISFNQLLNENEASSSPRESSPLAYSIPLHDLFILVQEAGVPITRQHGTIQVSAKFTKD